MTTYYAYVKLGGTATGDIGRETVMRTGAFEADANNYNSIAEAITAMTVFADGDIVIFLGAHDSNGTPYSANTAILGATDQSSPWAIISVNEQEQDEYLPGFSEGSSAGNRDISWRGTWRTLGFSCHPTDNFELGQGNIHLTMCNGTVSFEGSGDQFFLIGQGSTAELTDCIIDFPVTNVSTGFFTRGGTYLYLNGCTIASSTTGSLPNLSIGGGTSGGTNVSVQRSDLTVVTEFLAADLGNDTETDPGWILVDSCILYADVDFWEEPILSKGVYIRVTQSSSDSATAEYQYYYEDYRGVLEDNAATYRNESIAFPDSGNKISLLVTPSSLCSRLSPFVFEIPAYYIELSNTATDTLEFFLTCDSVLTDGDVWVEVSYPKAANKQESNFVSSCVQIAGSYTVDPLAAGTALTTDATSTWTAGLTNKYSIKVDTSGAIGADCVPRVRFFCATVEELYIDCIFDAVAS